MLLPNQPEQDIEREEIEFITKTLGCLPVAHIDSFTAEKLGSADLVEESSIGGADMKVIKLTGVPNPGRTVTVLARASNRLVCVCELICLSACLPVCLSASVCVPVCLCACVPVCLCACPSYNCGAGRVICSLPACL
jgi:hypothetical protein